MSLEQAVHQRWAADPALAAMLPPERFTTGRASEGPLPYATLARRSNRTVWRANSGDRLDETELAVHVWHGDYDAGRAVAERVRAVFDRAAFGLASGARVVQMLRRGDDAAQGPDGVWRFTLVFVVQVHWPPPD